MKITPALALLAMATPALAAPFADADQAAGKALHAQRCVACHERQYGGEEGSDIYVRTDRRVNTPGALASQITMCTTQLNLDLFPEDELNIAGYLNSHYYKFEAP